MPAAAIAIALGGVELMLRALDRDPSMHYQYDQQRGWSLRPGYAGWFDDENRVWVQVNSAGLRDREHPIEASPRTVRVAILGDSYVEAMNLPFEQSVAALLEQRLAGCLAGAGRQAEVINFGVGGYSTAQQLLTYRHHVLKYRPDVVLLAVYTSNDILDNSPAFDYVAASDRPYFGLSGEALVALDWPPAADAPTGLPFYQRWRLALTDRSHVASVAWGGWSALRAALAGPQPVAAGESADHPSDDELTVAMLQPPRTGPLRDAWRVTEALFAALADEVRKDGSEFWMTTLSTAEQVNPDLEARGALAKALGVENLYYPDDRISAFAASRRIPIVSLARPLADYAAQHRVFLHGGFNAEFPGGTGHWNDTAHRLAAGIIGDRLCAESRVLSAR